MEKDNIEVGEYIRTRKGLIFKVDKQFKNIQINEFQNLAGERDIVKHSKNIIDLIEVGDYVNGKKVLEKIEKSFLGVSSSDIGNNRIYNYMIKSHQNYLWRYGDGDKYKD